MVQVRQEPHIVLLPAPGEFQSVALDKGKPAGKTMAQGKEKRLRWHRRKKTNKERGTTKAVDRGQVS